MRSSEGTTTFSVEEYYFVLQKVSLSEDVKNDNKFKPNRKELIKVIGAFYVKYITVANSKLYPLGIPFCMLTKSIIKNFFIVK